MPRPKKTKDRRKARTIIFRVTDAQFQKLEQVAEKAGKRVNDTARIATLSNAERIIVKTYASCDPALLKRLDRIGNNLNQLVKNAHIFGRVSPDIEELCERISELMLQAISQEDEK